MKSAHKSRFWQSDRICDSHSDRSGHDHSFPVDAFRIHQE